jgi:hypothetical protein
MPELFPFLNNHFSGINSLVENINNNFASTKFIENIVNPLLNSAEISLIPLINQNTISIFEQKPSIYLSHYK